MFVKAESLIALNSPVMMFVIYSCIMLISWLGAKNVVAGTMTTGELSSVFHICYLRHDVTYDALYDISL